MAWILIISIAAITIWAVSLYKVFASPPCVPSNPSFLSEKGAASKKRNVLLVIAHPDDESMFFAPTILFLGSEGHKLHVLCLSTGNAEGKGNVRKEELYRACCTLKVPSQHVKILDHPNLQDGFGHSWDHQLIATIVEEEIRTCGIDLLLTFDKSGVSGHQNHCDVHHGVWIQPRGHQSLLAKVLGSKHVSAKYYKKPHKESKLGNLQVQASFASILALWISGYRHACNLAREKDDIA